MTLGGALSYLNDLFNADDIPFYYKPAIKAVMDTIALGSFEIPTGSTTKNDLADREFEGIEVDYPPEEICIYPEYKGKPYFGIKYKENGKEIVGYGTYNPEVLSRYLKDYFISTTKNNLDVDCISRKAVFETIDDCNGDGLKGIFCSYDDGERFKEYIKNLPPVKPQEPAIEIKTVENAEEAEEYQISEDISKGFEEFTKMMFKQRQAESEET